ncbi:hypothetical protein PPO43_15260 [Saprospira sp. CCB-QB6]|nr:hypothetical protein [Saprospira sp. CCB-QB6]WCL81332.1 hypothetical protein PPO43_15260 [Saprospira sp. CCB-QB6]
MIWGLPPSAGATLWGSQACSALRRLRRLGLAFGHPAASLGQSLRSSLGRYSLWSSNCGFQSCCRRLCWLGLAYGHPFTSLGRSTEIAYI